MVKILSLGKGMVLPHNAVLVLHSSLIKLTSSDSSGFPQLFSVPVLSAEHAALSALGSRIWSCARVYHVCSESFVELDTKLR
ncbi:hypothetical protein OS493_027452 [Desmophyllum pertusum]|uniref:Uncharacterized protein n=1 Tax=Desmophyllum pertusum TaxID=174260 RepID=A0A9W9Y9A4_9CNID|nr:hypothetical protein OS493_027452 [Desmophyllum pertusum]